ncbi:MAG: hypothetical protein JWN03_7256 [Nocardia sp.]|uniref:hypothetical protein n=1 Tax=Nocardia sp. TaxID=1821 RepID=UPI002607E7F6|nr:hypothetical protein [Nocardia sp.]MCU1646981.1 hypothetical protein [Nocardia sp.]
MKFLLPALAGAAAVLMAAGFPGPVTVAHADPGAGSSDIAGGCSWSMELSPRTLGTLNFAYPDSGAAYWILPYQVSPTLNITVSGQFPDARYMSFNTYDSRFSSFTAAGIDSALPDDHITPAADAVNPWQQAGAPGGNYSISVRGDASPGQPNVLPLAPAGTSSGIGYLIYRVYLPTGGPGAVSLPSVTLTDHGTSNTLRPCVGGVAGEALGTVLGAADDLIALRSMLPSAPSAPTGFRRVTGAGAFPNVDNAYLADALDRPADGQVVLIHGKAPTVPAGPHPTPWPNASADVRYFSLCVNMLDLPGPVVRNALPDNTVDVGCRNDTDTRIDSSGDYTYVVGTEQQRSAIEAVPGVTFVPWSLQGPNARHAILLRNMLPDSNFGQAVQYVAPNSDPAVAASVMGDYYPSTATCTIEALQAGNCSA